MNDPIKDKNNNYVMPDDGPIPYCKISDLEEELKEANSIIDTKLEELITATGLINQLKEALDASNIAMSVFQTKIKEQKVQIMRLHNGISRAVSVNNIRNKLVS